MKELNAKQMLTHSLGHGVRGDLDDGVIERTTVIPFLEAIGEHEEGDCSFTFRRSMLRNLAEGSPHMCLAVFALHVVCRGIHQSGSQTLLSVTPNYFFEVVPSAIDCKVHVDIVSA
jgi:hypothetical protein